MKMAENQYHIIVQSDWEKSLFENNGKAWVTIKQPGKSNIYAQLDSHGISSSGEPYVSTSEPLQVSQVTKKHIRLRYRSGSVNVTTTFIAPSAVLANFQSKKCSVQCLDVTPGGIGVSCNVESEVSVWNTSDATVRRQLTGHYGDVYTCRFFPSHEVILTGGSDTQLKIWSAAEGRCAATLTGHRAGVTDTCIVDRGKNIVSASRDGTVKLWSCAKQVCLHTFDELEAQIVNCCEVNDINNTIELGSTNHPSHDLESNTEGKLLLVGCENNTLQAWGLQTRSKIFSIDCGSAVNCCAFLSSSTVACGTQDSQIYILDIRNTSIPLVKVQETRSFIHSMLPYKQGFYYTTGDGSCVQMSEEYKPILDLTGPDCDPVYNVSCDGNYMYTACRDGLIRKYHVT